jgi:signal transduction histidine kinase
LVDPNELTLETNRIVVLLQDVSIALEQQHARMAIISTLADELRTPITTIINYADLLLSEAVGVLGTAQRKFLTRIKAGAERMAEMTNELGREAGSEEQYLATQHQLVDVSDLIETTVAGSCTQLEDREIDLRLDLGEDLPAVKADPDSLQRVLANLLSNACLATSTGGQVRVEAIQSSTYPLPDAEYAENGDGFVIVSVSDSGDGLSEEALNQVFDRSRPSQTPQGLGESGAGMALVRTLVEAHGGRLWVETEKGVGTTFSFVLPVKNVDGHYVGHDGGARQ